ncbi:hypothetical protein [Agrobacterium tumefaciens]|uniref:hypothetical protein n=1 Tax=Agrobacterium tumefaciens TaxID=358 RepID=UPI0021CEDF97|nr:hypothetical protein [Agrobacterium tumefaciens]UXS05384.1 hypothetical protein FY156_27880 [Agrobacterium tumefaciens]
MEFFTNMVRSCRQKQMKKELDLLSVEHHADLGLSRLGILTNNPNRDKEVSQSITPSYLRARRRQRERGFSWELG